MSVQGCHDGALMPELSLVDIEAVANSALAEDFRYGMDITTVATVPADAVATVAVVSRQSAVVCGIPIAMFVLESLLPENLQVDILVHEGCHVVAGQEIMRITGSAQRLLMAERSMLNILCHLSGVATLTSLWVNEISGTGTGARVRDTRKTLPGLRAVQKYAVAVGGGVNHRMGLGDAVLIKDNHIAAAGSVTAAVEAVRACAPDLAMEVEVDNVEQLNEVLPLHVGVVLLDNFSVSDTVVAVSMRTAVSSATLLESSGGLNLLVAADYAATGVDFLAVGELTHSARSVDFGLDYIA